MVPVLIFGVLFLLVVSGGLLLFYREDMFKRIADVINPKPKPKSLLNTIQQTGLSIGSVVERFQNVIPKSQAEVSALALRLVQAGYRDESAVKIMRGCKVCLPLLLCVVVALTGIASFSPLLIYVVAAAIGFVAPDFWLSKRIKRRQRNVRRGLPDVLDLLIVCIEAGLSMDQATARATEELAKSQPDLCDELRIVVLEQRAGRPRADAWKHFAERVDVDCVRNLVSMLVQAEQFGTSVARTLRVQSDTLRSQRIQAVEEMAAKTSVKLVFPLVLFIFPSLFLVVLGPPMLQAVKSLSLIH